ncbi:hypothetical protein LEMLEM_LOCUS4989, partial [Lemmus lemmus]
MEVSFLQATPRQPESNGPQSMVCGRISQEAKLQGDVWLRRLPILEDQDTSVPGDSPS